MFFPFDKLPDSSRVWIYQAERKFNAAEKEIASGILREFCESWSVHGQPLATSFEIRYDQFVVLAADESSGGASGCSIDSSVRAIKEVQTQTGVDLFNRNIIAFLHTENVVMHPMSKLKEIFASGMLNANTLTFNNLVVSKQQLQTSWIVESRDTWLKRFLSSQTVNS